MNHIQITNNFMDLMFHTKSGLGLSESQKLQLITCWKVFTAKGKEVFKKWSSDNGIKWPEYLKD
jgi:hypothetical protein